MIIRSLARRPNAVQTFAQAFRASYPARVTSTSPFARQIHHVPALENHSRLETNGIPGLLSKTGFKTAYTDYQKHMLDELNNITAGKPYENQETKSLVIEFARDPMHAYEFNVASMAFNNHFFFRGINTDPDVKSQPPSELLPLINDAFSSLDTLRESFIATAEAMFGPGFVWLVQENETSQRSLSILPTYIAGSPLRDAHWRRQSQDMNTQNVDSFQATNKVGSFGAASGQRNKRKKPLGGVDVVPLLCVNTWEHVWLQDYGVGGKKEFLRKWWDKIDWEQVRQNATIAPRSSFNTFHY